MIIFTGILFQNYNTLKEEIDISIEKNKKSEDKGINLKYLALCAMLNLVTLSRRR